MRKKTLIALSNDDIADKDLINDMRLATSEVRNVLSRRSFTAKSYRAIEKKQCNIVYPDGSAYILPSDEDIFGNDTDFRWLDNSFLAQNHDGEWSFNPTPKTYHRIRLLDLFFQIEMPRTVASFYR